MPLKGASWITLEIADLSNHVSCSTDSGGIGCHAKLHPAQAAATTE